MVWSSGVDEAIQSALSLTRCHSSSLRTLREGNQSFPCLVSMFLSAFSYASKRRRSVLSSNLPYPPPPPLASHSILSTFSSFDYFTTYEHKYNLPSPTSPHISTYLILTSYSSILLLISLLLFSLLLFAFLHHQVKWLQGLYRT